MLVSFHIMAEDTHAPFPPTEMPMPPETGSYLSIREDNKRIWKVVSVRYVFGANNLPNGDRVLLGAEAALQPVAVPSGKILLPPEVLPLSGKISGKSPSPPVG